MIQITSVDLCEGVFWLDFGDLERRAWRPVSVRKEFCIGTKSGMEPSDEDADGMTR